jgi:hypothetical protein
VLLVRPTARSCFRPTGPALRPSCLATKTALTTAFGISRQLIIQQQAKSAAQAAAKSQREVSGRVV